MILLSRLMKLPLLSLRNDSVTSTIKFSSYDTPMILRTIEIGLITY